MRAFWIGAAALIAAGCQQPADSVDMGPMPVVAALYDAGPLEISNPEWLNVWFSDDLTRAIVANATGPEAERLDFDFRSWANDPEVEDIRYAVGQHATPARATINTRFGYTGVPGGMNLTWDMCRLANGDWRIDDVIAINVSEEPALGASDPVTLRAMLGADHADEGPCG